MNSPNPDLYLRMHRRNMAMILVIALAAGCFLVASALWPDVPAMQTVSHRIYLIPIAIVIVVAAQQTAMRRHRMTLADPAFKALMADEWRQTSMDRATRAALLIILIAQVGLPLVFLRLPVGRALWGMAAATITLGVAAQVALYLWFERD